jgi:predicted hotdog family 3-hydroxylacyl-ACP dehydratase
MTNGDQRKSPVENPPWTGYGLRATGYGKSRADMPLERNFEMTELLPYEGRMLLLDAIIDAGPEHVTCAVAIHRDTMFCDGVNGVPSWVGLEYMAQTVSTYSGVDKARAGVRPTIGLLLGSRRYQTEVPYFAIGSRLSVHADLLLRDDSDLVAFSCTIAAGERVLARGDVKAYRPKDVLAIIRGERIE